MAMKTGFIQSHGVSLLRNTTSILPSCTGLTWRRTFVSKSRRLLQFPNRKYVTKSSLQSWFSVPMEGLSVAQEVGQDMTRKIFASSIGIIVLTFVLVALYGIAARQNYDAVSFYSLTVKRIMRTERNKLGCK